MLDEIASKTMHKDRTSSYRGNINKTVKPVKNINKNVHVISINNM